MDCKFRTAAVGGFNRRDVTDYLANNAEQCNRLEEELRAQIEEYRTQNDELGGQVGKAQEEIVALRTQLDELRARAAEMERELTALRAQQEEVQRRSDRAAALEADANAYALLKQSAADVEMDARCRAQEIVDKAQAAAERLRAEAQQWLAGVCREYSDLRSQMDAIVSHAASELDRARLNLEQMQRCMDVQDGALDQLGNLMAQE